MEKFFPTRRSFRRVCRGCGKVGNLFATFVFFFPIHYFMIAVVTQCYGWGSQRMSSDDETIGLFHELFIHTHASYMPEQQRR